MSLEIGFESAALGLQPAGFRAADVERIDLLIAGSNAEVRSSLEPGTDRAFFELSPGPYVIAATAFGENNLVLFTDALDVSIAVGDTVDAALELRATLGAVTLEIDGKTSGTVEAVAGQGVPFVIQVRNNENRPVPEATVRLTRSDPDYGTVRFDGTTQTDAQGRVTGVIDAAFSGEMTLSLEVDGRPIASPGPTRVVFATGVVAANSGVANPVYSGPRFNGNPVVSGRSGFTFEVVVRGRGGDPLPGVPVTARSPRNAGLDPNVDIIEPANGFESGKTDQTGAYRFTVRTFTSSFFELNEEGRLRSTSGKHVHELSFIEIFADGVKIDEHSLIWSSPVDSRGGSLNTSKQFAAADGKDFAEIIVKAEPFAQVDSGPVQHAFVELVDALGNVLNQTLDLTPAPGFDGFRTNAEGEWRGRLRSNQPGAIFLSIQVDGRFLSLTPRSVVFQ